jgi:hypothetical protein
MCLFRIWRATRVLFWRASLFANRDLRLEKGTALEVRLDRALQIPSH